MKKFLLILSTCALTITSGCQAMMDNKSPMAQDQRVIPHSHDNDTINRQNVDKTQFGYVRYTGASVQSNNANPNVVNYDRPLLADAITKMVVYLPDVDEAATLITDEYALITYQSGNANRELTAEQVRRTAQAVLPRYFDVYISDQPHMFEQIERFGALTTKTPHHEALLRQTIEEMKEAPQGIETDQPMENRTGNMLEQDRGGQGPSFYR